jgi:hypothetical protein
MFGSDFGNSKPEGEMTKAELEQEEADLDAGYDTLWEFLSGTDSMVVRGQKTKGLGLSTEILRKIYYQNTTQFLNLE